MLEAVPFCQLCEQGRTEGFEGIEGTNHAARRAPENQPTRVRLTDDQKLGQGNHLTVLAVDQLRLDCERLGRRLTAFEQPAQTTSLRLIQALQRQVLQYGLLQQPLQPQLAAHTCTCLCIPIVDLRLLQP